MTTKTERLERIAALLAVALPLLLAACEGDEGPAGPAGDMGEPGEPGEPGAPGACAADEILLAGGSFFPEGVALAGDGTLYIGSVATGQVVAHAPCGESPEPLAAVAPASAVGMVVDEDQGVLWVCASDASGAAGSDIVGFDVASGAELARHAFPDGGFCNDLALDGAGNLYATDSFLARVLVVKAADLMTDGEAAVWLSDERFEVEPGVFGLNGIAVNGAGDVYLSNYATGDLYRVGIGGAGEPTGLTTLAIDDPLAGPDGLELVDDATLLVVEGFTGELSLVALDGDEGTVELVANRLDAPTTVALDGDSAWVAEGQLDDLLGGTQPDLPFRVVRVPLP